MKGKSKIRKFERQMVVKGHTIVSIAKETGLSTLTVSEVLNGERMPSPKTSMLIAEAIGMNVEEFRATVYDAQQSA